MVRLSLALCVLGGCALAQAGDLTLDNGILEASLDSASGALTVLDRESGVRYLQPDSLRDPLDGPSELRIPRAGAAPTLDADVGEWSGARVWRLDARLLTGEKPWRCEGDGDLSAAVSLRWDDRRLYALFVVLDDSFVPAGREGKDWWEYDSAELWVGWDQVGYALAGSDASAFAWGDWKDWADGRRRTVEDFAAEPGCLELLRAAGLEGAGRAGWVLECASDVAPLIAIHEPRLGRRFRLAFGINDRDRAEGEREAQQSWPEGVVLGQRASFTVGVLCDANGEAPPAGALVDDGRPAPCRDAVRVDGRTLRYTLTSDMPEATVGSVRCEVRLEPGARELSFTCSGVEGWEANIPIGRGFLPAEGPADYVVPWYGNGVLISSGDLRPPIDYLGSLDSIDMPGIGVAGERGGALLLFDTHDHMEATLRPARFAGETRLGLAEVMRLSKGARLPEYRFTWWFAPEAGLEPLAARMRGFCESVGWVRTLADKRRVNPNLERLYGAPDVWGANGLAFARECASAGVRHMLINGRFPASDTAAMNDLGYLTGEYDQYVDTDDTTPDVDGVKPLPAHVRVERDGALATGWVTLDKSHMWYSRCSSTAVRAAEVAIPKVLAERPYNARFLDVHTAMGLVECWSEEHPLDRSLDRENKMRLLETVRGMGLVLGGEHGKAWSVKGLDYQEGMMSVNPAFSWPAGHLVAVDQPEQVSETYLRWGIGFERRVPFWELTFHDSVVSTWYWGDSVRYLERVRPDLTDRKVAFTALYGTVPLLWADNLELGFAGATKSRFLEVYRNCALVSEAVAELPMTSHRYLSEDRALQQTTFGAGAEATRVIANFAAEPREASLGGQTWTLPSNGILAEGPALHEHLALLPDGGRQTAVVRPDWRFHDGHGARRTWAGLTSDGPLTVWTLADGRLRVSLDPSTREDEIDLGEVLGRVPGAVRVVALGQDVAPLRDVACDLEEGRLRLPGTGEWAAFEVLTDAAAEAADFALASSEVQGTPTQARAFEVELRIANLGASEGLARWSLAWADGQQAAVGELTVAGRGEARVRASVDPALRDGPRQLRVAVEAAPGEVIGSDNAQTLAVELAPEWDRWTLRASGRLDLGGLPRTNPCASAPLPAGFVWHPESLRAALLDESGKPVRLLPAQLGSEGTVEVLLPGSWRGEAPRIALLDVDDPSGFVAPEGRRFDPEARTVACGRYRADLSEGALRPVTWRTDDGREVTALRQVIYSSPSSGWAEQSAGEIASFEVLADGPVSTTVRVAKRLPDGVTVTRRYTFLEDRILAEADASDIGVGLFHRVWYGEPGDYLDDRGNRAVADGSGKDEGIAGSLPQPKWFSLRAADWTHLCLALSGFDNVTWWDEGASLGQCGFTSARTEGNRVAHILLPPGAPEGAEAAWYADLTTPVRLEWNP